MNQLYFGDNLDVLRDHIPDERIDLIYLDPPFNSKRDYNLLYNTPKGEKSEAQVVAFKDSWSWGEQAQREYQEIVRGANVDLADTLAAMKRLLHEGDMLAYLTMLARRLIELHRVLKPSGSLYLHCDPTASHYLKIVLDSVFGSANFLNEIVWRRSHPKGNASVRLARAHDVILSYAKDQKQAVWHPQYLAQDTDKTTKQYNKRDPDGRRYQLTSLLNPNRNRPNLTYEFKGVTRVWRWTQERMLAEDAAGHIVVPRDGKGIPRYKRYLDEQEGIPLDDVWTDIGFTKQAESLGYPTQKPLALLERIIKMSCPAGGVVLDPFCGCGTAVHAAQSMNRQWIGIDITHLAIQLIEKRLKDAFTGIVFEVLGTPKDVEGARDLARRDPYQFEWWADWLVKAQPGHQKKKGGDRGIDGVIYFTDLIDGKPVTEKGLVSVKSGTVVPAMIRDLIGTVKNNEARFGLFVTLHPPTSQMITEAAKAGFFTAGNGRQYPVIQILTIDDLLAGSRRPEYFDASRGEQTFKRAPIEEKRTLQAALL